MTCLHKHDADERGYAALVPVLLLLRRVRFRPGYLFKLDPLLAVPAGKVLRDDDVTFAFVILRQTPEISGLHSHQTDY